MDRYGRLMLRVSQTNEVCHKFKFFLIFDNYIQHALAKFVLTVWKTRENLKIGGARVRICIAYPALI